ncbi:MAG TPA: hypothetical protein VKT49_26145 [Bryobacteraceae bacterium]|nr:hypothetical protein [Bryobacteraceae bacterium]
MALVLCCVVVQAGGFANASVLLLDTARSSEAWKDAPHVSLVCPLTRAAMSHAPARSKRVVQAVVSTPPGPWPGVLRANSICNRFTRLLTGAVLGPSGRSPPALLQ